MQRNNVGHLQRGLSLVEMSATLAVVAILAGTAIASLQGSNKKCMLVGTASQLATDLQYARSEALARDDGVRVVAGSDVTGIDNQEHPHAHLNAQASLTNQNFHIIPGQRPCPSTGAGEVDGRHGANYTGGSTVTHQP
jgi:prepilin-type N-terminal cleavage/methylation domain-containing protein